MLRVAHYLNQFFGQVGGEDQAAIEPFMETKPLGPGLLLSSLLEKEAEVVASIVCGDDHFTENVETAGQKCLEMIASVRPDVLMAGPAFNAGRYGFACGEICRLAQEELGLVCLTGMYPENPGVDIYRRHIKIVETGPNAAGMRQAMLQIVKLALKLAKGEPLQSPSQEGYLPHGIKEADISQDLAAARAVDMLLKKLGGEPFSSEITAGDLDVVEPAPAVKDLSQAVIALVTEGGMFPKGNPDRIETARATRFGRYSIAGQEAMSAQEYESIHRGYDTSYVNQDPHRLVPLDVLRDLEREGFIKKLFGDYFATTGVATTLDNGKRIGEGIASQLKKARVDAALVTAT